MVVLCACQSGQPFTELISDGIDVSDCIIKRKVLWLFDDEEYIRCDFITMLHYSIKGY